MAFSLSFRYGYYGNYHLVLGPNSSRLMETSSIFVDQIKVRGDAEKGLSLYGFLEKPELSLETNWTASNYFFVEPYHRQGFSLWLNKGSSFKMAWKIQPSSFKDLLVVLIKGEHNLETLMKYPASSSTLGLVNLTNGNGEAEYTVEEDDSYYLGVVNLNPQSIVLTMKVELSSKLYDTSKAKSQCSAKTGFCRLKLLFPTTQYLLVTTPNNVDISGAYVELSFVARLVTYVVILGFVVIVIYLVLKYLGACDNRPVVEQAAAAREPSQRETDPLLPTKEVPSVYGSIEEDSDSSLCTSSNDLYDGKICVICYDEPRNCFFVPCGHCATCFDCAQRIVDGDNKVCPICRRPIHKVRRLYNV